jgi:diguanylate cyclase (GGDEF)-like protein
MECLIWDDARRADQRRLHARERLMTTDSVSVLLVGLDGELARAFANEEDFVVRSEPGLDDAASDADAVVYSLGQTGPLEAVREIRTKAPDAAIVVVTDPANSADGAVAVHAGAEDHLLHDDTLPALLPRAVRYALGMRAIRRELATVDDVTTLPNLRGFAAIGEHHLRMADRNGNPVVFVFVRLNDFDDLRQTLGPQAADELARDAAGVVLEAVRDADVPARIASDTICVLLTGDAEGAENLVLSRLVEAMAVHDTALERPRSLSLSVGTARYEPGTGANLADVLQSAVRGLAAKGADRV